ncbi:MAG: DUF2752 domain-containing protein [Clostridia bacterium]|nr:DUF2752 domain-containing protein [Clostridia bacterium]
MMNFKKICYIFVFITLIALLIITGCPFYNIFKIECPACGTTRAWISFLNGDFKKALDYNLFFFIMPFFILYFLFKNRNPKKSIKYCEILLIIFSVLIFAYHLFRLYYQVKVL